MTSDPRIQPVPGAPADSAPMDGSQLCLACGLCCTGIMVNQVELHRHETEHVQALDIPIIYDNAGHPGFNLPCPRQSGTACTVYQERPRACRAWGCKLLESYVQGEAGLDECLKRVEQSIRLIERCRSYFPDLPSNMSLWQAVQERYDSPQSPVASLESRRLHAAFLLDLSALSGYLKHHFLTDPLQLPMPKLKT